MSLRLAMGCNMRFPPARAAEVYAFTIHCRTRHKAQSQWSMGGELGCAIGFACRQIAIEFITLARWLGRAIVPWHLLQLMQRIRSTISMTRRNEKRYLQYALTLSDTQSPIWAILQRRRDPATMCEYCWEEEKQLLEYLISDQTGASWTMEALNFEAECSSNIFNNTKPVFGWFIFSYDVHTNIEKSTFITLCFSRFLSDH